MNSNGRKPMPSGQNQGSPASQFGGPLNGQNHGYSGSGSAYDRGPASPTGRTVLEGYRNEIMTGFQREKPRFNPANASRPQSSTLVNVNDSIQVHLLVETALGDSQEYEILSQEEVDDLKKQVQALSQRIETTRQNLAIQSKYRDAAISMAKLYSSSDKKKSLDSQDSRKRRSLLGSRGTSEQFTEADRERINSERRCEELAVELWSLEKRLMEPQNRLLKHTAGILQMTHKGPKKVSRGQSQQQPGIPGSPESMYTYSNGRASMEPVSEEDFFDERSLYKTADRLDMFGGNFDGRKSMEPIPAPVDTASQEQIASQMRTIVMTEEKLEDLNSQLREVIIKANPQSDASYSRPPEGKNDSSLGELLSSHLSYLEKGLVAINDEQSRSAQHLEQSERTMEETIAQLNQEVRELLLPYSPDQPIPPQPSGMSLKEQLAYFHDLIESVETELSQAANAANKTSQGQNNAEHTETVLMGLWDIIQSGQADIRKKKLERRQTRTAQGYALSEDDMSDDDGNFDEPFSLPAFSAKVQGLYAQATSLKDQKKVLQRQIKQQRELNSKSDATKDAELAQKSEELQRVQSLLLRTEADANSVREQLSSMMEKLDEARQEENLRQQTQQGNESAAIKAAQEQLATRNREYTSLEEELAARSRTIADLEDELQDIKDDHTISGAEMQGRLADSENRIGDLKAQISSTAAAKAKAEEMLVFREKEVTEKEAELDSLFEKVAELQTEVTIARAELDGAYGSRSQRAAEVAANPAILREIDDLALKNSALVIEIATLKEAQSNTGVGSKESVEREKILKKELAETIEEFEQMTKASIEWEKERESLESIIDKLRDDRELLEAQLSDEKVRWLGMNSPSVEGPPTPVPGSTSTTILKNEFKKMMRDTRTESAKALRAEQEQRRRIEDELRALKRSMGPGKSGLSQSSFAA
ncbi:involucrin repeat protein [Phlyctema vagabunda]|uniref:Involucrin repeat protein n=1 Tax=Phlyctema vagabunda TaxID=108571 RepID=A0ABR4PTJ6_9HELO